MSHNHSHSHSHTPGQAHSHGPTSGSIAANPRAKRALWIALILGSGVLVAQVIAGVIFGSLALLGDAAHMLTDIGAYAVTLWSAHLATRSATKRRTFGSGRIEILAALLNGATLIAASLWIVYEAIQRLINPVEVHGAGMTSVAAVGMMLNALVLFVLMRSGSDSLNMRGAILHALGDFLGSLAAIIAGVIILFTGFDRADPIVSILLTVLILFSATNLVRMSFDVLLDNAPPGIDADMVANSLTSVDGAIEVHDVHVWTMSPGVISASAHVRIEHGADPDAVLDQMSLALTKNHGIAHSTLQLRRDTGSTPVGAIPRMEMEDAIAWATDHIAKARPELSKAVISAAASAVAVGLAVDNKVSPVAISQRTAKLLEAKD